MVHSMTHRGTTAQPALMSSADDAVEMFTATGGRCHLEVRQFRDRMSRASEKTRTGGCRESSMDGDRRLCPLFSEQISVRDKRCRPSLASPIGEWYENGHEGFR